MDAGGVEVGVAAQTLAVGCKWDLRDLLVYGRPLMPRDAATKIPQSIPSLESRQTSGHGSRSSSRGLDRLPDDVMPDILSRSLGRLRCHGSRSSSRGGLGRLPHDVMLNILSRLPARSLGRLRCVCQLWNSLFHDRHFVSLQLAHASKDPATFFGYSCYDRRGEFTLYSFKINARKVVVCNKFTVPVKSDILYVTTNSCNGLVGFYGHKYAYVANPCTREWMALPEPSPHFREDIMNMSMDRGNTSRPFLALGFSASSGKYKAVRFFYRDGTRWVCEVLTLGTDLSWRLLGEMAYPVTESKPAYANGHIYWTINADYASGYYTGPERVLSFDVCKEKFTTVKLPQLHPKPYGAYRQLSMCDLQGSIFLIDSRMHLDKKRKKKKNRYTPVMHIHMMLKSCSTWTKGLTFVLKACASPIDMFPIAIKDGKVLLARRCEKWRLHDLHTGDCQTLELPPLGYMGGRSSPFACAESIAPLDRLPQQITTQDDDDDDTDPEFDFGLNIFYRYIFS